MEKYTTVLHIASFITFKWKEKWYVKQSKILYCDKGKTFEFGIIYVVQYVSCTFRTLLLLETNMCWYVSKNNKTSNWRNKATWHWRSWNLVSDIISNSTVICHIWNVLYQDFSTSNVLSVSTPTELFGWKINELVNKYPPLTILSHCYLCRLSNSSSFGLKFSVV